MWMVEAAEVKAVDAMSAGDSHSEPEVSGMGSRGISEDKDTTRDR